MYMCCLQHTKKTCAVVPPGAGAQAVDALKFQREMLTRLVVYLAVGLPRHAMWQNRMYHR
jgi:hypothetical protein